MNRRLLFIFLIITSFSYAQTISDFNSDANTEFSIVTPTTSIDQTASGANTTWIFDISPTSLGTNIDTYAAPDPTELATFPGTTDVLSITTQGTMPVVNRLFQRTDVSGTFLTGAEQSDVTLNFSVTNAFIGLFPLSFGTNNSGPVNGTFNFNGVNGTFNGTVTSNVDAYGTLTIFDGASTNYTGTVTRLRVDQSVSLSIPPIFNNIGTVTQTSYTYYDNGSNNILFRYNTVTTVSAFLGINDTTESFEVNVPLTLGMENLNISDFKLYPIPANDKLTIRGIDAIEIERLTVINVTGKEVIRIDNFKKQSLDISALKSGLYLLRLEANGTTSTKKFIKR